MCNGEISRALEQTGDYSGETRDRNWWQKTGCFRLKRERWNVWHEYDRCVEILVETQRKMTETRSQNFTAIYRPFAVEFVKVCRYETFWLRIFARRTFLLFRCYSILVKLCVLVVEFARNWVQKPWWHGLKQQYAQRHHPWAVAQLLTLPKKNRTQRIYNSATPYGQAE